MIHIQSGDTVLRGDLGALFACSIAQMAYCVAKRSRGNKNVEFGVPFFDDLDFLPKALLLSEVSTALFDPQVAPLSKNAWHDATLTAVCKNVEMTVARAIIKGPPNYKYASSDSKIKEMVLAAFQSLYPGHHGNNMRRYSNDEAAFHAMAKRLAADFTPNPWFLVADVEPKKRDTLMQRMNIPQNYFEIPFSIGKTTKMAMRERCGHILDNILGQCWTICGKGSPMSGLSGALL